MSGFFGKLLPKEKREQAKNYVSVFYLEFLEVTTLVNQNINHKIWKNIKMHCTKKNEVSH